MDRSIPLLVIGLVFGGGIGFMVAAANGVTLDGHDHGSHAGDGSTHAAAGHKGHGSHEEILSLPAGAGAPTLDVAVSRDPETGWNLHVRTTGFRFAPQNAGKAHVPGEGHAHVYVNGEKIARLYGPWMHIASFPGETARIDVTLNANDHRALAIGDRPLKASTTIGTQ